MTPGGRPGPAGEGADNYPWASGDEHAWVWDEGSSGLTYEWCTRCHEYKEDVKPNEYHGWLRCRTAKS